MKENDVVSFIVSNAVLFRADGKISISPFVWFTQSFISYGNPQKISNAFSKTLEIQSSNLSHFSAVLKANIIMLIVLRLELLINECERYSVARLLTYLNTIIAVPHLINSITFGYFNSL